MALAYEVGLTPEQFWGMTAREFLLCIEGYSQRQKEDMRKRAWEVSLIMAATLGRDAPTAAQLLGEETTTFVPEVSSPEEFKEYMRKRKLEAEP